MNWWLPQATITDCPKENNFFSSSPFLEVVRSTEETNSNLIFQ